MNGFKDILTLEKDLEASKIALSLKADMNLYDSFNIFDKNEDGYLTHQEFREGLACIGIYPTNEELDLFFIRYSKTNSMSLSK